MKAFSLEKGKLYEYSQLIEDGFKFARIKVNREIDSKHVKKMKDSMEAMGGAIMPLLVITADVALNQSLKVILEDGSEVNDTTKDKDKILVIIEGQHRCDALKRLHAEGNKSISAMIMLPLVEPKEIVELLQEVNTSVNPWDGIDWLTSLNITAKSNDVPVDAIEFVKELSADSSVSDSAAWIWAKGNIISKAKIIREIKNGDNDQIKKISYDPFIKERKKLYRESKAKLGDKLVCLKRIPNLLCEYEAELVNKGVARPDSWEKVITFISNLNTTTVKHLKEAKKTDNKTKDQVITSHFNTAWKDYISKLDLPLKIVQ